MRYLGLVENVRVRRAGFAYRASFERFAGRYRVVSASTFPRSASGGDARADTCEIFASRRITDYQLGRSMIHPLLARLVPSLIWGFAV